MKLAGQVGIVTGAGRGIGTGIALALAREGMAVAVTSRSGDQLDQVVATIESEGGRAIAVVGDVADHHDAQRVVRRAEEELGPVDLLVNNAGRGPRRFCPLWEADMQDWWDVLRVNLLGPALGCHVVLPGMLARGRGRIVTIGSLTGADPNPTSRPAHAGPEAMRLHRHFDRADGDRGDGPSGPGGHDHERGAEPLPFESRSPAR